MAIRIGRVALSTPQNVPFQVSNPQQPGIGGRRYTDAYSLEGMDHGSTSQATMTLLARELKRMGAVWCEDDNAGTAIESFPSGYYKLQGTGTYQKPPGAPRRRPWNLDLLSTPRPCLITRQAEDDNATGTDTPDTSGQVDEDIYVDYTTTGAYVTVLDPRNVAGAEDLNLAQDTWKAVLRAYPVTTATAQVRWRLVSLAGAVLATGADVTLTPASAWKDFDLGNLAVPAANHQANWFEVQVRDTVNVGSHVRLDRLRLGVV